MIYNSPVTDLGSFLLIVLKKSAVHWAHCHPKVTHHSPSLEAWTGGSSTRKERQIFSWNHRQQQIRLIMSLKYAYDVQKKFHQEILNNPSN